MKLVIYLTNALEKHAPWLAFQVYRSQEADTIPRLHSVAIFSDNEAFMACFSSFYLRLLRIPIFRNRNTVGVLVPKNGAQM
jgi:hypothetical protein